MQRIDIPKGARFGRLTVIRTLSGPAPVYVLCKCDCGRTTKVYKSNLLRGKTKSCGCGERENLKRLHDALRNPMTPGDKYGMLTVLRNTRVGYSEFRCDCGKVVEKSEVKVRSGETKSCGCLRVKEWARIVGISCGTLQTRLNHGWTVEDAFTVRPERGGGKYKHKYHDKTVRLAKADS